MRVYMRARPPARLHRGVYFLFLLLLRERERERGKTGPLTRFLIATTIATTIATGGNKTRWAVTMASGGPISYIAPMYVVSVKKGKEDLQRLRAKLSDKNILDAMRKALGRTMTSAKTEANRGVRGKYQLSAAYLRDKIVIKTFRTSSSLTGTLSASNRGVPISEFKPSEVKGRGDSAGIYVKVLKSGGGVHIRSAWLGTVRKGASGERYGVFARGKYKKGDFAFRKKRMVSTGPDLPINQLRTTSPYVAVKDNSVLRVVETKAITVYEKRLMHEIKRISGQSVTNL